MGNQITLELTRYCNYECKHCFINAGHRGKNLTLEQVEKIVDHLPDNLDTLTLTGGEVFTQKPLLHNMLYLLQTKPPEKLKIETNGFWAKDEQNVKLIIKEIKHCSPAPAILSIGSTKYHQKFGRPLPVIKNFLKKNGQDEFVKIDFNPSSHWLWNFFAPQLIFPMGRGKATAGRFNRLVRNLLAPCATELKGNFSLDDYSLYITNQGNIYGCCPHQHKELGNAAKAPIKDLLILAQENPYFQALNEGGIEKAALALGLSEEDTKRQLRKKWICDFCGEITREFFDHI